MESWEGYNYYTRNSTKWVELMNLSTIEWAIGPLPAEIVAIPGSLNDSYHFPDSAIVIERASKADFGNRGIEKVVFGLTSGLVLLWAFAFLLYNIHHKTLFNPRGSSITARSNSPLSNTPTIIAESEYIPDDQFRHQLRDYYYPPIRTELEEYEKNAVTEPVAVEDVEAVTHLLRKMYDLDLGLWSLRHSQYVPDSERQKYRDDSDAILAEIRRTVGNWQGRENWNGEERHELTAIVQYLTTSLPERRYA